MDAQTTYRMRWGFAVALALLAVVLPSGLAPADTLLLHSVNNEHPSWVPDVKSKLEASGRPLGNIDTFNASLSVGAMPTLSTLLQYDSILLFSFSSWSNASTLGNLLAQYVDAGGGLVISMYTLAGRPVTGNLSSNGYYPILPGSVVGQNTSLELGTVYDPSSPILKDVQSFEGGSVNTFHGNGALAAGAVRIADWNDANGTPLVATLDGPNGNGRIVALNFFPASSDVPDPSNSISFWNSSTDGATLIANALLYAAGVEIDAPPEQDPIAAAPLPPAAAGGTALLGLLAARQRLRRKPAG